MIKKKKLLRNIVIILTVFCIIVVFYPASASPITALRREERAENYGPSVIIKTEKFNNQCWYLCKYDKWYSIDTVERGALGLWYSGTIINGYDLNSEPVEYREAFGAGDNGNKHVLFGRVNDRRIKSVKFELQFNNKKTKIVEQNNLYDNLFLIFWDGYGNFIDSIKDIQGLDENSKVVFEKKLN